MTQDPARGSLRGSLRGGMARLRSVTAVSLMRLWCRTWRMDAAALAGIDTMLASDLRVMAVFWHRDYVPLFALAQGRRAVALTSGTGRGLVLAEISRAFGFRSMPIGQGHPLTAIKSLRSALADGGGLMAVAIDGPLGPPYEIKTGALRLASQLDCMVVPISVRASGSLVLKRRWDRMVIPLPFTRVTLLAGEPVAIPGGGEGAALAAAAEALRAALESLSP
jgi:hypothetical protein